VARGIDKEVPHPRRREGVCHLALIQEAVAQTPRDDRCLARVDDAAAQRPGRNDCGERRRHARRVPDLEGGCETQRMLTFHSQARAPTSYLRPHPPSDRVRAGPPAADAIVTFRAGSLRITRHPPRARKHPTPASGHRGCGDSCRSETRPAPAACETCTPNAGRWTSARVSLICAAGTGQRTSAGVARARARPPRRRCRHSRAP